MEPISFGSFELYRERFINTSDFESHFEEATKVGSAMIQALMIVLRPPEVNYSRATSGKYARGFCSETKPTDTKIRHGSVS